MAKMKIKIGARKSELSICQTNQVADALRKINPSVEIEIIGISSRGDLIQDKPLSSIGKGVFVKELDDALINGEVDLCVHSLKDVPTELPDDLMIAAVPLRESPFDTIVGARSLDEIKQGSLVGTGSDRRRIQLQSIRPDLKFKSIRGNIDTRLRKWREGQYDAIVLASAGLKRMGLGGDLPLMHCEVEMIVPAPAQGALGIAARKDTDLTELLLNINDDESRTAVDTERELLMLLGGGCQTPFGAYAEIRNGQMKLTAAIGNEKTFEIIKSEITASVSDAKGLAENVLKDMKEKGAGDLI